MQKKVGSLLYNMLVPNFFSYYELHLNLYFPRVRCKGIKDVVTFLPMAMVLALSVLSLTGPSPYPWAPFDKLTSQ